MNNKKHKPGINRKSTELKAFEDEVENMLRSTGKMFPITPEQVEALRNQGLCEPIPSDWPDPLEALISKENQQR